MFRRKPPILLTTDDLDMRLPVMADHEAWVELRKNSKNFLGPWEPKRRPDQHSREQFKERVTWSADSLKHLRAVPLMMIRRKDQKLVGSITLDYIRMGPSRTASVGYWLGEEFTKKGYMKQALIRLVTYAFTDLDLSRIEAATLEENKASRKLLENSGFRYEGVAQSYLQINGRWRPHVLYANLRRDRLGSTETGVY